MLMYVLSQHTIRHGYNATLRVDSTLMRVIVIKHAPRAEGDVYIKIK
jgi:hypothetical protein